MKHNQDWTIVEDSFAIEKTPVNETLFSLGNGYLGMRGTFEEGLPGCSNHTNEGTYINGFYENNPLHYGEKMHGFAETSQVMLNVANAKIIVLEIDGKAFNLLIGKLLDYKRTLDLKTGVLCRWIRWRSPKGKEVEINIERSVLLNHANLAYIKYTVTPLNFSGNLSLGSLIDDAPSNTGDEDDPRIGVGFKKNVFKTIDKKLTTDRTLIIQQTTATRLQIACGIKHNLVTGQRCEICKHDDKGTVGHIFKNIKATKGRPVTLRKYITYVTSFEFEPNQLANAARRELQRAAEMGVERLQQEQTLYLKNFWDQTEVVIEGDDKLQRAVRFNMFHLLQATGKSGLRNVPAKGLSGQGYEGHYLWDTEIFILPLFLYTNPEIARKLLEFRFYTLDKARERAQQMSHSRGALYPWRTINGEECSSSYDRGTAQFHINADIAFAIKRYMEATEDHDFLKHFGAEILFETARFWVDLGHFSPKKNGQFSINSVTGPDEYTILVDNNTYTNMMAREHLRFASEVAVWLQGEDPSAYAALVKKIGLGNGELVAWRNAAEKMYLPSAEKDGVTPQDDSFLTKAVWDFDNVPKENYPLLLHYHPLVIDRHQVCKQPDLILAEFLLHDQFDHEQKRRDYDYYEKITTHDSSLSPCIFGILASEAGYPDKAYAYFSDSATTDLDNIKGNTKDGIHAANMAGSWMSIVFGFAGMRISNGILSFSPTIPEQWTRYYFHVMFRARSLKVSVGRTYTDIQLLSGEAINVVLNCKALRLGCADSDKKIQACIFDLDGVITDTAEYHFQAWSHLAEDEQLQFTREDNEKLLGVSRRESLELLVGRNRGKYSEDQMLEMMERKNGYYKTLLSRINESDILPNVKKMLATFKRCGIKTAIGSSSKNARFILERLGLLQEFDAISDGYCAKKMKPAPDIFLCAAEQLGVPPGRCIVVEDASAGVEAALAANMTAVGIGPEERVGKAHFHYPAVVDIDLDEILGREVN